MEDTDLVNRLVDYCRRAENAPKPARKPRAIVTIDERGRIAVRHRAASGEWTTERFATLADAQERQRELMGS